MKRLPVRLGPLALLLTVITICLTILSILTFTTARGDLSLARRFAETVRIRSDLDLKGNEFLAETDELLQSGVSAIPGTEATEEGWLRKTIEEEGYRLTIDLDVSGTDYEIVQWKLEKLWEPDEDIHGLWQSD